MEKEREGKGEMRKERRGRGIVIGGMVIGLLMGCNNGIAELEKKNESILSISNLRKGFLDIFTTFGGMVSDALGINADTTKKGVGEELGRVGDAVKEVKGKLEGIKGSENYNLIKDKADSIIANAIGTLSKIVDGTDKIKKATAGAGEEKIANATTGNNDNASPPSDKDIVKSLVEGINLIYGAANEAKIDLKGKADKQIADSAKVGTLFNQTSNVSTDAKALNGANRAVNTASGADILAAIKAVNDTSKGAGDINAAKNAYDIAIANKSHTDLTTIHTNASVIAAGLALRAMAQGGKLATVATHAPGEAVNAVLIGVVRKTVNEIVSTIRKTVDQCLKNVSD